MQLAEERPDGGNMPRTMSTKATEVLALRLTDAQVAAIRLRHERRKKPKVGGCGFVDLKDVSSAEPLTVVYEFWRVTQSQYHYREIGKVDLGLLDEVTK
jgi:hypothetical protein